MGRIISESPLPATQAVFNIGSYWCYQIPTPEVSLVVLSPQGRHSATYTEHMPNERTAYSDATNRPWESSHNRPPRQGPDAAHPFRLPATLDVGTDTVGTRTPNPPLTDQRL